ncbi:TAXI family TRAP transporter solute-binding subunit [Paracoccus zeaxanthinifaciens]|uniref:TAXI family TRAP transporter solute-binding subunit n=1 Tax=Paracoccus zeaxanthinifaciens TaxID=187400 RepID=UPI0003B53141|nr:TAXI family TRAP transporter solute-binding subunit [Paracoccus zeaxanthinifaciens]
MKFTAIVAASMVAALPAFAQDRADWPSSMGISTGSQGGSYFVWGSGLASMMGETLDMPTSVEVTGGPVQNVALVDAGELMMGFTTLGPAQEAMEGESELMPGVPAESIRALFPMYQTPLQAAVLTSSGIGSIDDLVGKRVNMGPATGTSATYWQRYFEAEGMDVNASFAGASDAAGQLSDGLIDAFVYAAGLPAGAFSQLAVEQDVKFLGLSEENIAAFVEAVPTMQRFTIPADTYEDQPEDVPTVAMWNFAIAHKDMPDSLAYEITKLVMENNDRMLQVHASAVETLPENWDTNEYVPFHPGAVQYFEEKGIEIPENLR